MNHYINYSVEDFVQDFRFRCWVRNSSHEEDYIWQCWIRENSHKRIAIEEARAIVLSIHPVHGDTISDAEVQNKIEDILANIGEPMDRQAPSIRRISFPGWLKIAASVSILAVVVWYGVFIPEADKGDKKVSSISTDHYMIERVNRSEDTLLINLPDSSSVLLSQNSLVRYPVRFTGDARHVTLKGTAFFEVNKDPHKPFYVNAGRIVAKALGTSFEVSMGSGEERIRVIVKSGAVSIYSNPEGDQEDFDRQFDGEPKITLSAHEKFVLEGDQSKIQHTRLDASSIEKVKLPDTYLKFNATSVSEVFKALSKVYGVRINYEDTQISECSVTASFTDEPFALKLDLICSSIGLRYEMINDEVTILGRACKNY